MLQVIWVYRVRPPLVDDFTKVYSTDGAWAQLFSRHPGYRGTRLLKDASIPNRFMTMDFWADMASYEAFKAEHADDYRAIDGKYGRYFEDQRCIGFFETDDASVMEQFAQIARATGTPPPA